MRSKIMAGKEDVTETGIESKDMRRKKRESKQNTWKNEIKIKYKKRYVKFKKWRKHEMRRVKYM
jgi:hypothetical protein